MGLPERSGDILAQVYESRLILDNEFVSLWYYPDSKIVHHRMKQTPPSEAFRELLSEGAYLVERFRAPKWLSDDRENTVLRDFDEEWAQEVWVPRVLRGGFRYWAIVPPTAAIGRLNMQRLARFHFEEYGIRSHVASSLHEGFDWLRGK